MVGKIEAESGGIFTGPEGRFEGTRSRLRGLFLLIKIKGTGKVAGVVGQSVMRKNVEILDFPIIFIDD